MFIYYSPGMRQFSTREIRHSVLEIHIVTEKPHEIIQTLIRTSRTEISGQRNVGKVVHQTMLARWR